LLLLLLLLLVVSLASVAKWLVRVCGPSTKCRLNLGEIMCQLKYI